MPKLKLVNAKSNETAVVDVEDLRNPVFDIVRNYYQLLSVEPTYESDETVKTFLKDNVSLQIMTKKVSFKDILDKNMSFKDIGVENSMKIGIFVDDGAEQLQSKSRKSVGDKIKFSLAKVSNPLNHVEKKKESNTIDGSMLGIYDGESSKSFDRDAVAIAPSKKLAINEDDGYDAEVTLDDFKNYYEHIRRNSSNDFPDFSEKRKEEIPECHIRIKFPDRTILQAKFSNTETSELLYDFVTNSLEMPDSPFELYFAHPLKLVKRSDKLLLIRDLGFEKRTSLIFKTHERNVPYLKKSIQLRDIFEEERKQKAKVHDKDSLVSEIDLKKQKLEKKMAKFLKLSKK
ncbi:hypothetical protein ACO0R3_003305 [Hanseniaspora guilliermondii]